MKILFVYYHRLQKYWKDGLFYALNYIDRKINHRVIKLNIHDYPINYADHQSDFDVILGWGGLGSPVDQYLRANEIDCKKALCLAGNVNLNADLLKFYDLIFYETDWIGERIKHNNKFKAFGVNKHFYNHIYYGYKIWDWLSVGAFASWKRHTLICNKPGNKMVIGEIQEDNFKESKAIIDTLITNGVAVSDIVHPEKLRMIYQNSKNVYIPANINGGGERAVLEARSCGCNVEVENDNPKLKELVYSKIPSHIDYADNLLKGLSCLN